MRIEETLTYREMTSPEQLVPGSSAGSRRNRGSAAEGRLPCFVQPSVESGPRPAGSVVQTDRAVSWEEWLERPSVRAIGGADRR